MNDFTITAATTGRGRGRPLGSGGYAANDHLLFPIVRAVLKPTPMVATLRDAVAIIDPLLVGLALLYRRGDGSKGAIGI